MRFFKRRTIRKGLIVLFLAGIIFQCASMVVNLNDSLLPQVEQMAKAEASNAASQIIKRAVASIEIDPSECMQFGRDEAGSITEVIYNTAMMNQILSECLDAAQSSLSAASAGVEDPNTNIIYYDGGVIYSVHLGYFTGIAVLSQMGPNIEVHMKVVNSCSGEIQVTSTPYGINCTLIQIDVVITTQMLVVTPFLLTQAPVECRFPIVIQIVQGKVPDMIMD